MNNEPVAVVMTEEQKHMHRLVSDADKLHTANIVEICAVNRSVNEWVTNAEKRIANLESQLAAPKTKMSYLDCVIKETATGAAEMKKLAYSFGDRVKFKWKSRHYIGRVCGWKNGGIVVRKKIGGHYLVPLSNVVEVI